MPPPSPAIGIIVPVSNSAHDLTRRVDSILLCTSGDYRLLLIDDASPDPAIGAYFEEIQSRGLPQVHCVSNENNIGFTLTANRGMSSARTGADVVLLNSDPIVTRDWLEKLVRCA